MDVKLTVFPEHVVVDGVDIEMVGITAGFTVIVMVLDITVDGDTHTLFDVRAQVI